MSFPLGSVILVFYDRLQIISLKNGDDLVADSGKMTEMLNSFFCSLFTREDISHLPAADVLFEREDKLETVAITSAKVVSKCECTKSPKDLDRPQI